MSKLIMIPAYIISRPRLFWGIVLGIIFAILVINCGFTRLPDEILQSIPTPEASLISPTNTPEPAARQNPEFQPPTPTPLPAEYHSSPDQTVGIILGASVLLLTILIGTLSAMRSQQKKR